MTSINGNFGLFGNNGDKRIGQQKGTQKPAEVKPDVPVGKTENVEYKESGDKLLESANFYAGMGISLGATKKPEAGSLEDLQSKQDIVLSGNVNQNDVKNALAMVNAIPTNNDYKKLSIGLDILATYRNYPERFGKLQTPEEKSGFKSTEEYMLNTTDILDSIAFFA